MNKPKFFVRSLYPDTRGQRKESYGHEYLPFRYIFSLLFFSLLLSYHLLVIFLCNFVSFCNFKGLRFRDANLWRSKIWRFFPSGLPTPPPRSTYPLPLPSPPPPTTKHTHPSPSSSFRIQEYSATIVNLRENRVLMSRIFIG